MFQAAVATATHVGQGVLSKNIDPEFRRYYNKLVSTNNNFRDHRPMDTYLRTCATLHAEEVQLLANAFALYDPVNLPWQGSIMGCFIEETMRLDLLKSSTVCLRPISRVMDRSVGWLWLQKRALDMKDVDFVNEVKDALIIFSDWSDWMVVMTHEGAWTDDIYSLAALRGTFTGNLMLSKEFGYKSACEFTDWYCDKELEAVFRKKFVKEADLMAVLPKMMERSNELKLHEDIEKTRMACLT